MPFRMKLCNEIIISDDVTIVQLPQLKVRGQWNNGFKIKCILKKVAQKINYILKKKVSKKINVKCVISHPVYVIWKSCMMIYLSTDLLFHLNRIVKVDKWAADGYFHCSSWHLNKFFVVSNEQDIFFVYLALLETKRLHLSLFAIS